VVRFGHTQTEPARIPNADRLASTFMIMVEQHLAEHPAVRSNPEWDALATTAVTALTHLYHAIHKAHLAARQSSRTGKG
jgi:hypothetical protein